MRQVWEAIPFGIESVAKTKNIFQQEVTGLLKNGAKISF